MKLVFAALMLAASAPAVATERPVIRSHADLPPVRFAFAVPPSEAMDQPALAAMLPAIRAEAERLLRDYDIQDATIAQNLRFGLAAIAVADGRKADADALVADFRAHEAKPQGRAIGGLLVDLAAATLGGGSDACTAASARLADRLKGADPVVVRDQFLASYSSIQTSAPAFYAGTAVGAFDPVVKERGSLDVLQALSLVYFRVGASAIPSCRGALTTVARRWLDDPANRAIDIWPERQPKAADLANAKPVSVAVWDSGYDISLFPGQLARDPAEPLDGIDNDGNGTVDDSNGPTYDTSLHPRGSAIMPPTRWLQSRLAAQMAFDKGELDLRFGFDTPEATQFADFARSAAVDAQGDEFLAYLENAGRVHGTACASEIADDAPYVRLYNVAALPWGRGEDRQELAYDEAVIARWATAIDRSGARMRGAGVRVVNMSWGFTADEIIQQLLDHKLEADPTRAKARGLAMQKTIGDALEKMMRASPNILFVAAAGNSNQEDAIQADSIQRLSLPNLMIVGATGSNGRPTAFTVFGAKVAIYAQGEAVRLRWPGNIVAHMSGTSMAAPQVARAAAQMLAVAPRLSAAELRAGLVASATAGEGGLRLLHPAAAVAWARRH